MDALTSGAGQYILPILAGGASLLSPRIGAGVNSALGVMDWARKNKKVAEEEKGYMSLADALKGQAQAMGIPPEVLQNPATAKALAPVLLQQQKELTTPQEHFTTVGDQPTIFSSAGKGQPWKSTPVGEKAAPNYAPAQDSIAMQLYGKRANQLNQEEWGKASDYVKQQAIEKEDRSLERYFTKQNWLMERQADKNLSTQDEVQLRADTAKARTDYGALNKGFQAGEKDLNTWYANAKKNLPLGGDKKKQAEAALEQEFNQKKAAMMDDYTAGYQDWQTQYGHVQDRLKGFGIGGTPKVIESRRKRLGEGGGGGGVTIPDEMKAFDPVKLSGRTGTDSSGKKWRSNGKTWIPME
jgi:hypothetical protein